MVHSIVNMAITIVILPAGLHWQKPPIARLLCPFSFLQHTQLLKFTSWLKGSYKLNLTKFIWCAKEHEYKYDALNLPPELLRMTTDRKS